MKSGSPMRNYGTIPFHVKHIGDIAQSDSKGINEKWLILEMF